MGVFFETKDQALVALYMMITGFATGLIYDFLSVLKVGKGKTITALVDIFIFAVTGLIASAVLVYLSQARVRYYDILGLLLGAVVYIFVPRKLFVALFSRLTKKQQAKQVKENGSS